MNVLSLALAAGVLLGNPQGGTVVSGSATIDAVGKTMTIRQGTDKAIINWQKFENTASETVRFIQPGSTSLALNRVVGVDPSSIAGALSANGRVFLLNPNGIVFGPTARVNVGSIVASTLAITDTDFNNNNFRLLQTSGAELGSVVNQGNLTVSQGGLVALVAPIVSNDGTVVAAAGRVFLVGTTDGTVSFDPHNVTNNASSVPLTGGRIPTIGLSPLLESIINTSSIASPVGAARVEHLSDGTTFLRGAGGIVANGGTIDTSGGGGGGQIRLEGLNAVALGAGSLIDAGTGNVAIKAVKGDVYQHRLDGAIPAPAFVKGADIIVEANDRLRTTDSRDLRIEGTGKVTLRGRDMVGRGDSRIQVKAARLDVLAERGEVALFVDGDTIADQVLAGVDNTVIAPVTLNFASTGTVLGGSGFVHFNGKSVTLDIAGDLGSFDAPVAIGSGGRGDTRTLNINVAGTRFDPPFSVSSRLQGRISTQDQFNTTAASASPTARSNYSPPVDAPDPVVSAPVVLPADPVAPTAPSVTLVDAGPAAPSTSGGSTVGASDNVLLPALRTDRARNDTGSSEGSSATVADGSGGLIDVASSSTASTELDGSSPEPDSREDRVAQLRRRAQQNRQTR